MHWKNKWIEPSLFIDKIRVSGVLRLIPIDEIRCRRIREMSIHIGIFGVGPILEGMVAEQEKKQAKSSLRWWKSGRPRMLNNACVTHAILGPIL